MNVVHRPKSLPWLARRAGVPDRVADALWRKALALAGAVNLQAADPHCQAEAMPHLLLMLGLSAEAPIRMAAMLPAACDPVCQ